MTSRRDRPGHHPSLGIEDLDDLGPGDRDRVGHAARVDERATCCAPGLAALGAVGLFISTLTEQPLAATVALMIFTILSWIADSVPQISWLHPWLLVDHWMAFGDLLRDPPFWDNFAQGLWVDLAYAVVFGLLAWARFAGKDITS